MRNIQHGPYQGSSISYPRLNIYIYILLISHAQSSSSYKTEGKISMIIQRQMLKNAEYQIAARETL